MATTDNTPICIGCKKEPKDIPECVGYAAAEKMTPDEFVIGLEGTYNPNNGHFLCTECYINWGMPSSSHGWKAP